jgi:hypothetical protein
MVEARTLWSLWSFQHSGVSTDSGMSRVLRLRALRVPGTSRVSGTLRVLAGFVNSQSGMGMPRALRALNANFNAISIGHIISNYCFLKQLTEKCSILINHLEVISRYWAL